MLGQTQFVGGARWSRTLGPTELPAQMAWNPARYGAEIGGDVMEAGTFSLPQTGAFPLVGVVVLVFLAWMLEKRRIHLAARGSVG